MESRAATYLIALTIGVGAMAQAAGLAWGWGAPGAAPTSSSQQPACSAVNAPLDQLFESNTVKTDYRWTPFAYSPSGSVAGVALAQTVTVGRTGTLERVAIDASGRDLTEDLPVEIRAGSSTGRVLARGKLSQAALQASGWIDVPVSPGVRIRAGSVIAIVLPALQGASDADLVLRQPTVTWVTSPGDTGYGAGSAFVGERLRRADGVTSWDRFPFDRQFRTYVCSPPATATQEPRPPSPTPPASVIAALIGGLLGAVLVTTRVRRSS